MADSKPGRGSDQFPLRFPEGMRDQLKEAAEKGGRSMNAEIIARLALTLQEDVWDRQKFIDTLNFRQYLNDKIMHTLILKSAENRSLNNALEYEKAIRLSQSNLFRSLCHLILEADCPNSIKETAKFLLSSPMEPHVNTDLMALEEEIRNEIGDREDVPANWEETLSEEDKERLADAKRFIRRDSEIEE